VEVKASIGPAMSYEWLGRRASAPFRQDGVDGEAARNGPSRRVTTRVGSANERRQAGTIIIEWVVGDEPGDPTTYGWNVRCDPARTITAIALPAIRDDLVV
jgi:hypothetical protein